MGQLNAQRLELVENEVGVQIAGGTAILSECIVSRNDRNGIEYTDATATLVEKCTFEENGKHGIYIAITPYDGVLFRTVIRHNQISGNGGAGIYFADQPITTQREFRIENNFILHNETAGVEVYLEQPDPKNLLPTGPRTRSAAYLVNNTIVGSPYGVLRGGNFRIVNNIFAQCSIAGIQDVDTHSVVIRNLFWENQENSVDSNFNSSNNIGDDPMFVGEDYVLSMRSPAKRAGIPGNLWNDTSDRSGTDIGASR
jgi:parallel beta-helix repeat protein